MRDEQHDRKLVRWAREGTVGNDPVPAATVVLLRDGEGGIETLMLRRASKIAFGGMWVFPGGRVDAADLAGVADGDEIGAARLTAVRETREETGLELDAATLVPLSHWTPAPIAPRRFLTWFFVAPAPAGAVVIDDGEIREYEWMPSARAMERRDAGEIELAPPTWVTLHVLGGRRSVAEALAHCCTAEPERFETHIGIVDDDVVALWHGDAGYEDSDPTRTGARHRLAMTGSPWRYERGD